MAGTITISASVGIFTVIAHKDELFRSLESRYSQLRDFYEDRISPLLSKYFLALSAIFQKQGEWLEYINQNKENIYELMKPQKIKESYQAIEQKIWEWYEALKSFLQSIFSDLSEQKIRTMIYTLSQISNGFLGMLTVLKNFLEYLIQGEKEKLPPDFLNFLKNTWVLFSENSGIIGELEKEDYNAIFNYMSEDPKKFNENIESLKSIEEKWGKYTNKYDFLRDVLPSENSLKLLLEKISQAFIECGKKKLNSHECWGKYTSKKDMEEFLKIKDDEATLNYLKENRKDLIITNDSSQPVNPSPE